MGEMYYDCPNCGHCQRMGNLAKAVYKTSPFEFKDRECARRGKTFNAAARVKLGPCPGAESRSHETKEHGMNGSSQEWRASSGEVVRFKRKHLKPGLAGGIDTFEEWTTPSTQAAKEYLNTRSISRAQYYLVVETPEGNWGKDMAGVYKEQR